MTGLKQLTKEMSHLPRLTTIQAKKEVLDYLITTLDYIEYNMPEDLLEVDGEERQPSDIVRILASIRVLREEFIRRTKPKRIRVPETKPITRKDIDRAKTLLRQMHARIDIEAKAREKYGDGILGDYLINIGLHAVLPPSAE